MFYRDNCAKDNQWPETGFKSRGKCEICGHVRVCNDMPSSRLLDPPLSDEDKKRHVENRRRLGL